MNPRAQIKAFKEFRATGAWVANLYVDGRLVAHVENRGDGGSDRINWVADWTDKPYEAILREDYMAHCPEDHWTRQFVSDAPGTPWQTDLYLAFLCDVATKDIARGTYLKVSA